MQLPFTATLYVAGGGYWQSGSPGKGWWCSDVQVKGKIWRLQTGWWALGGGQNRLGWKEIASRRRRGGLHSPHPERMPVLPPSQTPDALTRRAGVQRLTPIPLPPTCPHLFLEWLHGGRSWLGPDPKGGGPPPPPLQTPKWLSAKVRPGGRVGVKIPFCTFQPFLNSPQNSEYFEYRHIGSNEKISPCHMPKTKSPAPLGN